MRRIFVSYRRADSEYAAGALGRELRRFFGDEHVFRDKEDITGGVSWRQHALCPKNSRSKKVKRVVGASVGCAPF